MIISCSGTGSPVSPGSSVTSDIQPLWLSAQSAGLAPENRYLWGYWNMRWNPDAGKIEATPVRSGQVHINILRFLEDTLCKTCLVIGDNSFTPEGDLEVSIGINSPITEDGAYDKDVFTGFDVRGIAIFKGTEYFDENGLAISSYDNDEYTINNADGYTTLWSPALFAPDTYGRPIFEYYKGNYEVNGVNLPTTLNPYRAFYTLNERRVFEAGGNNQKVFRIHFPADPFSVPLEFGYAVDASWAKPSNMDNPKVPDDFPVEANCVEAYRIEAEFSGEMTKVGGEVFTILRIYDWQGTSTIEKVTIEAPDLFNGLIEATFAQQQALYSEYTCAFQNYLGADIGTYPVLVTVTDVNSAPVIGKVNAYNVFHVQVYPLLNHEATVEMTNFPIEGCYDPSTSACYFGPLPGGPNLSIIGIDADNHTVTGFPSVTAATGSIGLCRGTSEIFVPTDYGNFWTQDVTVFDINNKIVKQTIDIPSLSGKPGSMPLDILVYQNSQEVWASLYNDNQVAVWFAGTSSPDIIRISLAGTGPTTLAIDETNYRIFAACDGDDSVAVIDGFGHTLSSTIDLYNTLVSPDPGLPATAGMAYVPSTDTLYVATLMHGMVDFYTVGSLSYAGSIKCADEGTIAIVGLTYDPGSNLIIATGQTVAGHGKLYAIDPATNTKVFETNTSALNPSFMGLDDAHGIIYVPDPAGLVDVFRIVK
jgi:hypothetical protein